MCLDRTDYIQRCLMEQKIYSGGKMYQSALFMAIHLGIQEDLKTKYQKEDTANTVQILVAFDT